MSATTFETPQIIRGAGWVHERGRFVGYNVHDGADLGLDERERRAIAAERNATKSAHRRFDGSRYVFPARERAMRIATLLGIRSFEGAKRATFGATFSAALFDGRVADREEDLR